MEWTYNLQYIYLEKKTSLPTMGHIYIELYTHVWCEPHCARALTHNYMRATRAQHTVIATRST